VQAALRGLPARVLLEIRDLRNWSGLLERLEAQRPEVVLLDLTSLPRPIEECVQSVRTAAGSAMLITLHTAADPEIILTAVRSGANEFLYPPLQNTLRRALERRGEERARVRDSSRPTGKILGFFSVKGGCGATTIACHLAAELGKLSVQRADRAL